MGKTTEYKDQMWWQSGKGFRMRRIATGYLSATAAATTYKIGLFIAPCTCRVTKVSINAVTYPDYATATLDCHKANIGAADTALITQLSIDAKTAETEYEATLASQSARDLIEGQLVYATITIGATEATAGACLLVQAEYMPTER